MLNENQIEHLLPANIELKYKLAVKALVLHGAPFDAVCLGCGIDTDAEIDILNSLLSQLNHKLTQFAASSETIAKPRVVVPRNFSLNFRPTLE